MSLLPHDNYLQLMQVIRRRLDVIHSLSRIEADDFYKSESAAFHGRKIIEGIAFGCLVATENGLKSIPKDAKGQYNAEKIFKHLKNRDIQVIPSPSLIRPATKQEQTQYDTNVTIEGIPERRLTHDELIKIYIRLHNWLHELNPYTKGVHESFHKRHSEQLWSDLSALESFMVNHVVSISGEAFYCTLRDKQDGFTKVISLSKGSEL